MKRIFFLMTFLCCKLSFAQIGKHYKAGWGILNYSVPESPASKLLGSSPDNMLMPASVRNVAFTIGNYFLTGSSLIPKNMAVEIAPLLLNGKASLNEYNKNKFLYRLRISMGTNVLNNGGYSVAEGIRLTLIDRTDLRSFRSNPDFSNFLYTSAVNNAVAHNRFFAEYAVKHSSTPIQIREQYYDPVNKKFKQLIDSVYADRFVDIEAVSAYRDSIRDVLWNAPVWELGIATLQSSRDSLVKNLKSSQIGIWSTAALPVGKKGQLLIGAKVAWVDSVQKQTNVSIGERFYYGSNEIKGFIQAQYEYTNGSNGFTAGIGCQFNVSNGIWGEVTINLVVDGTGRLTYQPGFNISLATPEKKRT